MRLTYYKKEVQYHSKYTDKDTKEIQNISLAQDIFKLTFHGRSLMWHFSDYLNPENQ